MTQLEVNSCHTNCNSFFYILVVFPVAFGWKSLSGAWSDSRWSHLSVAKLEKKGRLKQVSANEGKRCGFRFCDFNMILYDFMTSKTRKQYGNTMKQTNCKNMIAWMIDVMAKRRHQQAKALAPSWSLKHFHVLKSGWNRKHLETRSWST